jgi:hypothetical protein
MTKLKYKKYWEDADESISRSDLASADRDLQLEVMEIWFREKYEDPAERTPYESAEGGYIWIYGGPFSAQDELEEEFGGAIPNEIIQTLAEILTSECYEWTRTPTQEDYDDFTFDDIVQSSAFHDSFSGALTDIRTLLEIDISVATTNCLNKLLFINVITSLETYLSDAFIKTVMSDYTLIRRFVETTPEFKKDRVSVADIFKEMDEIKDRIQEYLIGVVWHNLDRVIPMYRDTLSVGFPEEIGVVFRAIHTRHDLVHRNGKNRKGQIINVSRADVLELISVAESLIGHLDRQLTSYVK